MQSAPAKGEDIAKVVVTTAAIIRRQIETSLANRIPAALTPRPHEIHPVWATGVASVDELLGGGLPVGSLTEMVGPECSGRTSLALSYVAACTRAGRICAWIDVSDTLSPESAAAAGVRLDQLLWVRCGVCKQAEPAQQQTFQLPTECFTPAAPIKGLYAGGWGGHPRTEVNGIAGAVSDLLAPSAIEPRCAEPQKRVKLPREEPPHISIPATNKPAHKPQPQKPWARMEQAMRATDLLLQTGGFAVVVLDMAGLPAEAALRVPLATWFRYRAAAERTQASVVLLTQRACAKSSAGLVLKMEQAAEISECSTVFTGLSCRMEVLRERFQPTTNVVLLRKPPMRASVADWQARSTWAGVR